MKRFYLPYSRVKRNKINDVKWVKIENIFFDKGYIELSVKHNIYIRLKIYEIEVFVSKKLNGFIEITDISFSKKDNLVSLEYIDIDLEKYNNIDLEKYNNIDTEHQEKVKKKNIVISFTEKGWSKIFK